MTSKVSICNRALIALSAPTITSLTDGTQSANYCNTLFDQAADLCIYMGYFSSTLRRASLAQETDTPVFGYTYQYALPTSPYCLKVIQINEDTRGTYEYRIEGRKLLTDLETVSVLYAARLTDTEEYGAALTECVTLALQALLCAPLTGDKVRAQAIEEKLQKALRYYSTIDNQQNAVTTLRSDDINGVR